jgi:YfiH family protein
VSTGLDLITPDWIGAPANVGAFATGRAGGVSRTPFDDGSGSGEGGLNLGANVQDDPAALAQNRQLLLRLLPAEPLWLRQVHGNTVVDAGRIQGMNQGAHPGANPSAARNGNAAVVADAAFTTIPGVVCAVTTADCLPVLLCDTAGKVVAAAHAGWRGLAGGVLQQTVGAMKAAGAGQLLAWLGPAIGPTHFEVGHDVFTVFVERDPRADAAFRRIPGQEGKYLADLYHLARLILADCGVARIAGGQFDTAAEANRFYSYRRDGRSGQQTGRMASVIWLK